MTNKILRALGIGSWIACILVLAYQSLNWVLNASWPALTMMDASQALLGIDLVSLINSLPFEFAIKTTYILVTTELSIALWWIGVVFFGLTFVSKIMFSK
ncbi:MAG: potassium:proton antiporter [Pseudodesulfovibrio sp.]